MSTRASELAIDVGGERIAGTLVTPGALVPGVLCVHGWGGCQEQYVARARDIAALGCVCLTFDLRGHGRHHATRERVTRDDNLRDVLAAYDVLAGQPQVDAAAIAVVGSSYGAYLAVLATRERAVRWLGLRVPALYRDADWERPKTELAAHQGLGDYRRQVLGPEDNGALAACAAFAGDALVVESEHDDIVPHQTIENYVKALAQARSLTYRVIDGADHGLASEPAQRSYTELLVTWLREMVFGARGAVRVA